MGEISPEYMEEWWNEGGNHGGLERSRQSWMILKGTDESQLFGLYKCMHGH